MGKLRDFLEGTEFMGVLPYSLVVGAPARVARSIKEVVEQKASEGPRPG